MTTSVTIVNHGPNAVKVNPSGSVVYALQSRHAYVWEGGNITIEEILPVPAIKEPEDGFKEFIVEGQTNYVLQSEDKNNGKTRKI